MFNHQLLRYAEASLKTAFVAPPQLDPASQGMAPGGAPPGGAPPMDPSMGGAPPGGAPPMDPGMGAPPMDPSMGGAPPMDPGMGAPPMDPSMGGAPPAPPAPPAAPTDPSSGGMDQMRSMIREELAQLQGGAGGAGKGARKGVKITPEQTHQALMKQQKLLTYLMSALNINVPATMLNDEDPNDGGGGGGDGGGGANASAGGGGGSSGGGDKAVKSAIQNIQPVQPAMMSAKTAAEIGMQANALLAILGAK